MKATELTLHMSMLEDRTASFIVRIWRERGEGPGDKPWRGSLEHAQSGTKSFFVDLPSLVGLIEPYIQSLGRDDVSTPPTVDPDADPDAPPVSPTVPPVPGQT